MTSNKRARELARAKYERQQARRNAKLRRQRLVTRIVSLVVVVGLVAGGVGWYLWARQSPTTASDATSTSTPTPITPSDTGLNCEPAGTPRPDDLSWPSVPVSSPESNTAYRFDFQTNCGDIRIVAQPKRAPQTVAAMSFLTQEGFFDNTVCHRVTTEGLFVLQCGDPAGNGSGGPGFEIPDENLPVAGPANYPAGTVAMANSGANTSGSQFFIVYADTELPPNYTIWGRVTRGLDIVESIAAVGTVDGSSDGLPAQPVFIKSGTVTTSPIGG